MGMTRAKRDAHKRERQSNDGESRFLRSGSCRPIILTERAVHVKLARKIYRKRRSKKNLEGLYEVLAPDSNIIKESPTVSTKKPGKATVTVRNSDIAKFGTLQERQTPLKFCADRRWPCTSENLIDEKIKTS